MKLVNWRIKRSEFEQTTIVDSVCYKWRHYMTIIKHLFLKISKKICEFKRMSRKI